MSDYRVLTCPHCGAKLNRTAGVAKAGKPQPKLQEGAVTMCFACGEWSVFDANLDMRKPTEDELAEIALNPVAQKLREAMDTIRAGRST